MNIDTPENPNELYVEIRNMVMQGTVSLMDQGDSTYLRQMRIAAAKAIRIIADYAVCETDISLLKPLPLLGIVLTSDFGRTYLKRGDMRNIERIAEELRGKMSGREILYKQRLQEAYVASQNSASLCGKTKI